ncbi:MAG: DUF1848 domain-containing protein [Bulleidia sp.]|nr:DUF1848 domain-containing protein [Bulleidia sp.]
MIINTGQRTDIPAFYAEWFASRLKEGFVCVRNPFDFHAVTRYQLNPDVVDLIGFCSKNPAGMFPYMDLLKPYHQFWYVTLTPYGKDIEPNVPDKHQVIRDFQQLSSIVGKANIGWRYDPVFLSKRYDIVYHLRAFETIAKELDGYTDIVVISFIDLYEKVKRSFPEVQAVPDDEAIMLGKQLIAIAKEHHMTLKTCSEGTLLEPYGADCRGCMTVDMYEKAIGQKLNMPSWHPNRTGCACYLACDIGAYDSCMHLCRYCYANNSRRKVLENHARHDPHSPFLIGNYMEGDRIHDAVQKSWRKAQISMEELL